MPIVYHVRKNNNSKPDCTIAFDYDENAKIMFVAWSKPNIKMGDSFSRKRGYQTAITRVERFRKKYPNKDNNVKNKEPEVPRKVLKSIDNFLPKAHRYFKKSDPNNCVVLIY